MKDRIINNSYLHIAFGAIMISFSAVFVKASNVSPNLAGFYRTFFGSIPLSFFFIYHVKKKKIKLNLNNIFYPFLAGVFFFGDLMVWHQSIHFIGPGLATVLANFQVFILAAIGILFYKEKITLKFAISLPFVFIGLIMISSTGKFSFDSQFGKGIILGLTTSLFYAGYVLSLKKARAVAPYFNSYIVMFLVSITTAFMFLIYLLATGQSMVIPDSKSILFMICYGFSSQFIAWVIISNAINSVKTSIAGLLLLLQPSLSFVWDVLFFDKPLNMVEIGGAVIALFSIYIGSQKKKENKQK